MNNEPLINSIWDVICNKIHLDESFTLNFNLNNQESVINVGIDTGNGLSRSGEYTSIKTTIKLNDLYFSLRPIDPVNRLYRLFKKNESDTIFKEINKIYIIKTNDFNILNNLLKNESIRNYLMVNRDTNLSLDKNNILEMRIEKITSTKSELDGFLTAYKDVVSFYQNEYSRSGDLKNIS